MSQRLVVGQNEFIFRNLIRLQETSHHGNAAFLGTARFVRAGARLRIYGARLYIRCCWLLGWSASDRITSSTSSGDDRFDIYSDWFIAGHNFGAIPGPVDLVLARNRMVMIGADERTERRPPTGSIGNKKLVALTKITCYRLTSKTYERKSICRH
jgi:hypothetical protein